ncbi:Protein ALP1-like [Merluccius polli]|uniref:Protein ALP1-like n=1 Tax=Merluccius polli TaxID=89951 RepID=A0AA47NWS3_MERPO|nr:Protein ALP1-like [Merluccius polli]
MGGPGWGRLLCYTLCPLHASVNGRRKACLTDGGVEFADGARRSQQPHKSLPAYNNKAALFLQFVITLLYCKMDPVVARRVLFRVSVVAALLHVRRRRRVRLHWVHPILRTRNQRGEFHSLVQELRLDSLRFEQYFRMPPEYFDELLSKVGPLITRADTSFRSAIDPAERLAICLRYLATGDSFRTIGFSYRVGTSSVCRIVREVASAIWTALVEEVMPVPTMEDWSTVAEEFEWRWNFPNCVGAIDGKHVVLQAPSNSGSLYFNYKGTFSLVLLAVVDANYLFRVVDVGGYGRTSDSGSLRNSVFGEALRDGTLDLPPDRVVSGAEQRGPLPHVFVGDEAFPLMTNLLRPFPGRNHPPEKRVFNYRLSRARLVVECAFGILASRWRMYRRVIATSPPVAEVCVKATCVLHNFLRRKKLQRCRRRVEPDIEPSTAPEALRHASRMGANNANRATIQMREAYCAYFNEEGAVAWQPRA